MINQRQKWTYSSATNPCPICDRIKDDDCRIAEDGSMVLCHSSINGEITKDGWQHVKPNADDRCGIYVILQEKSPRPRNKTFTHSYIDRQGREHVQRRKYDAAGKKDCRWTKELGIPESQLLPYHWEEVEQAIKSGKPIYLAEGELKADELVKMGLTATNLRVSPDAQTVELFRGANLIICPDRDREGIKKAQARYDALAPVAASIRMCLSEPNRWDSIPEKGGRDLHDWIIDGATFKDIEGAIESFDLSRFADKAEQSKSGESDLETKQELTDLQAFSDIAKPDILPQLLMIPLRNLAGRLNLPVEAFVGALLPVCSSQLRVDTRLELDPTTNFYVRPILWVGIVGETGSKKSPLLRAIISPLDILQQSAEEQYQHQLADYDEELQEWESAPKKEKGKKGKKPKPPSAREYYLSDFTIEALGEVLRILVGHGFLINIEELARFFSSMDAYRNGKGGDRQHWLSFYDGGPFKSNRKSTGRVYAANTSISLVGGIQPGIVQNIMTGDGSLEDGLWSRFAWVRIPITASPGIQDGPTFDLSSRLKKLYESLAGFEVKTYKLSYECKLLWNEWHHEIEQLILKEPSGIIRASYPKAKERAARIALVTHVINAAMGDEEPTEYISEDTLRNAIQFTRWLMGQTRLLYAECGIADNPETAKILKFVNRFRGCGWVTTRMVRNWSPGNAKMRFEDCRTFAAKIVELGYATDNGKQGAQYQIEIIQDLGHQVTHNFKGIDSNSSRGDQSLVTTWSPRSLNSRAHQVTTVTISDLGVVTDGKPSGQEFQEVSDLVTTNIEKEKNYKPGDRVEVTAGRWKGQQGIVRGINDEGGYCVDLDDGKSGDWLPGFLKLVEEVPHD